MQSCLQEVNNKKIKCLALKVVADAYNTFSIFGKLVFEERWLQEVVAIRGTSTVSAFV